MVDGGKVAVAAVAASFCPVVSFGWSELRP